MPGGRTGVGLLAGMTGQPRRGYAAASLLGVSVWALYLVGVGYVAGHTVDSVWVSIGIALALMAVVSTVAAVRTRRDRTERTERTEATDRAMPAVTSPAAPVPGWRPPARTRGG